MVKPQREFCLVVQRVTLALSGWSASQRCIFLSIIAFVFLYSDQGCDVWNEWWTTCNLFALVRTRSGTNAEGERPASALVFRRPACQFRNQCLGSVWHSDSCQQLPRVHTQARR